MSKLVTSMEIINDMSVPMPENGPELCINVWWFALEDTDWVDQWAVRSYMLIGKEDEKVAVLKELARYDYINVEWQPVPQRFTLIAPDGQQASGASTLSILRKDEAFFQSEVLNYLQQTFTQRNFVTTCQSGKPHHFEISRTPLQVDTVVFQTHEGRLQSR